MRTLVLGDVHGANRALVQVLERAQFKPGEDRLIFLGDVCDGWPEVAEAIRTLEQAGAEGIWGNHDEWTDEWLRTGLVEYMWFHQGGVATLRSFGQDPEQARILFGPYFASLKDYIYDEERDYLFVHGGLEPRFRDRRPPLMPHRDTLMWDRSLWEDAVMAAKTGDPAKLLTRFKKVFIGHTQTNHVGFHEPVEAGGVVLMDQGAGWPPGRLSLMDIDTGEVWQSDVVGDLYPDVKGRGQ